MPDSLGRGVVDLALACSVELATHLQREYAPADALLPNPKWAKTQTAKAFGRVEQEYWAWDNKASKWLRNEDGRRGHGSRATRIRNTRASSTKFM